MVYYGTTGFHCGSNLRFNRYSSVVSRDRYVGVLQFQPGVLWQRYKHMLWHMLDAHGTNTWGPTIEVRCLRRKYMVYYGIARFLCGTGLWFNTYSPVFLCQRYVGILQYVSDVSRQRYLCILWYTCTRDLVAKIQGTLRSRWAVSWHKYVVYYGTAVFHWGTVIWFNTYSLVVSCHRYVGVLQYGPGVSWQKYMCILWYMPDAQGTNTWYPTRDGRCLAAQTRGILRYSWIPLPQRCVV